MHVQQLFSSTEKGISQERLANQLLFDTSKSLQSHIWVMYSYAKQFFFLQIIKRMFTGFIYNKTKAKRALWLVNLASTICLWVYAADVLKN